MSQPSFPGGLTPEDPDLNERQRRVFAALLLLHGDSAHPVSSEALSTRAGIPLSPASIRSALAELETMGLLERPHPSAGRVPTARGYALYVRSLLTPAVLPPQVIAEVDRTLMRSTRDIEHLLHEASRLLSSLTSELGLAHAVSLDPEPLVALELASLDPRRVMMVLTLGQGAVDTLALELDSPLERREVEEVERVLRERLLGRPFAEVRARLAGDPELARGSAVRAVAREAVRR